MAVVFDSDSFATDVAPLLEKLGTPENPKALVSGTAAMLHLGQSLSHRFDVEKLTGQKG